jgi:hypothetical protein
MTMKSVVGRWLIIAFVVLHMTAVALYAIPWAATSKAARWARAELTPRTHPYILTFSQWQQWNLFSPDPLRRVSFFEIRHRRGDEWVTLRGIRPGDYPWWRHSTHFKLFGEFLDSTEKRHEQIIARYLQRHCRMAGLAEGTTLQLVRLTYVIPKDIATTTSAWRAWKPSITEIPSVLAQCPDEAAMNRLPLPQQ